MGFSSLSPDEIELKKYWPVIQLLLTPEEKEIIVMRTGLLDGKEYSLREIAEHLGFSRQYVACKIQTTAQRIKNRLTSMHLTLS